MANSPVLYVYYPPLNDDAYPGVPNRHITEADWARFSLSQRRTVENATTQEGYTRRKVWVHRDLVDETEQERAEREAREQAARDAYERGQSIVRWRDFETLVPGPGEVIVGGPMGPVAVPVGSLGGDGSITEGTAPLLALDRFWDTSGTALTDHQPDNGPGWTAASGVITIQNNRPTTGSSVAVAVQQGIASDVEVSASFLWGTTGGIGVVVRYESATSFWFGWVDASSKVLRIYEVAGGTTSLKTATPLTLNVGERYTLVVRAYGDFVQAEVSGYASILWDEVTSRGAGIGIRVVPSPADVAIMDISARRYPAPPSMSLPTYTASNAPSPLLLPEMYGDTQGVHPDVIDCGAEGWEGFRYWMAWTPYTDGVTARENPSIAVSHDGETWTTPPGLTNPVVDAPATGYHSDPDIVLRDDTLYMIYRTYVAETQAETLSVTESRNGIVWKPSVPILRAVGSKLVAPSLVCRNGQWILWTVKDGTRRVLERRTAPTPYGPWSAPRGCSFPNPDVGEDIWHHNVTDLGSRYAMIFSSEVRSTGIAGGEGKLFYAESLDGINWTMQATPVMSPVPEGTSWDDEKLYRSSITPTEDGYDLIYSAHGQNRWRVGRAQMMRT